MALLFWPIGGFFEEGKESIFLGHFFATIFGAIHRISAYTYIAIYFYSFFLVYKYAKIEKLGNYLGLIFLGLIFTPILTYNFSKDLSPFNESNKDS